MLYQSRSCARAEEISVQMDHEVYIWDNGGGYAGLRAWLFPGARPRLIKAECHLSWIELNSSSDYILEKNISNKSPTQTFARFAGQSYYWRHQSLCLFVPVVDLYSPDPEGVPFFTLQSPTMVVEGDAPHPKYSFFLSWLLVKCEMALKRWRAIVNITHKTGNRPAKCHDVTRPCRNVRRRIGTKISRHIRLLQCVCMANDRAERTVWGGSMCVGLRRRRLGRRLLNSGKWWIIWFDHV